METEISPFLLIYGDKDVCFNVLLCNWENKIANCIFLNVAHNIQSGILCNLFVSELLKALPNVRLVFFILCEVFSHFVTSGIIIVDFSKTFDLVPHGRLLTKTANSGVDARVVVWIREFLLGRTQSQGRRATIRRNQSNVRCAKRWRIRSSSVHSLR